jgi:hypothetical protein
MDYARVAKAARTYMIRSYQMLRSTDCGPDALAPLLEAEAALWEAISGVKGNGSPTQLIEGCRALGVTMAGIDLPGYKRKVRRVDGTRIPLKDWMSSKPATPAKKKIVRVRLRE